MEILASGLVKAVGSEDCHKFQSRLLYSGVSIITHDTVIMPGDIALRSDEAPLITKSRAGKYCQEHNNGRRSANGYGLKKILMNGQSLQSPQAENCIQPHVQLWGLV